MKYKLTILLVINFILTLLTVGLVVSLYSKVDNIKMPTVITKVVSVPSSNKSFACTGVLNETLVGASVPSQAIKSDSQAIEVLINGSSIKLSGVSPITINCNQ